MTVKKKVPRKGLVVWPIRKNEMNSRCQVDLLDLQRPDQDFLSILNYQDHLTKNIKMAEEVAYHLLDVLFLRHIYDHRK